MINETTAFNDGGAVINSSSEKTDKGGAGRFTFSQVHKYLYNETYPNSFEKSNKQALRKQSNILLFHS